MLQVRNQRLRSFFSIFKVFNNDCNMIFDKSGLLLFEKTDNDEKKIYIKIDKDFFEPYNPGDNKAIVSVLNITDLKATIRNLLSMKDAKGKLKMKLRLGQTLNQDAPANSDHMIFEQEVEFGITESSLPLSIKTNCQDEIKKHLEYIDKMKSKNSLVLKCMSKKDNKRFDPFGIFDKQKIIARFVEGQIEGMEELLGENLIKIDAADWSTYDLEKISRLTEDHSCIEFDTITWKKYSLQANSVDQNFYSIYFDQMDNKTETMKNYFLIENVSSGIKGILSTVVDVYFYDEQQEFSKETRSLQNKNDVGLGPQNSNSSVNFQNSRNLHQNTPNSVILENKTHKVTFNDSSSPIRKKPEQESAFMNSSYQDQFPSSNKNVNKKQANSKLKQKPTPSKENYSMSSIKSNNPQIRRDSKRVVKQGNFSKNIQKGKTSQISLNISNNNSQNADENQDLQSRNFASKNSNSSKQNFGDFYVHDEGLNLGMNEPQNKRNNYKELINNKNPFSKEKITASIPILDNNSGGVGTTKIPATTINGKQSKDSEQNVQSKSNMTFGDNNLNPNNNVGDVKPSKVQIPMSVYNNMESNTFGTKNQGFITKNNPKEQNIVNNIGGSQISLQDNKSRVRRKKKNEGGEIDRNIEKPNMEDYQRDFDL